MITVAGAPVSFGVFELGPGAGVTLPGPDEVCSVLQATGYAGVDLGPPGFLGRDGELRERLHHFGLELAGGWVDMPFFDTEAFDAALADLDGILDIFVAAAEASPSRLPLPTLAATSSEVRRAHPGGGPEYELTAEQWGPFAENITRAAEHVRRRGLEPTFHHHACTYVETPAEIDELLARADVGLTLDTGHLILGGGDPLDGWRRWSGRINHLHAKDARVTVLRDVVASAGGMRDVWEAPAFVPFGAGDLDLAAFMDAVTSDGYDGWLVVEQDTIPKPDSDPGQVREDHRTNREALRPWA